MSARRPLRLPAAFWLALALAVPALGSPAPVAGASHGACLDAEEARFVELINAHRAEQGLAPLAASATLSAAADVHSADMAATGYFDHTMADGTTVEQNLRNNGYDDGTYGENIAGGVETAGEAFDTWRNSATHNQNMLRGAFGAIGVGRAYDESSPYGWYWTTTFGGEFDEPARSCDGGGGRRARTTDDVNLRRGPGPDYDVAQAVPPGVDLPVVGEAENGYLPVALGDETVWVAEPYVAVADESGAPAAQAPAPATTVTETVTLRAEPDRESAAVAMIPAGSAIELTGAAAGEFVPATWEGNSGWVDAAYVSGAATAAQPAPANAPTDGGFVVWTATTTDELNLRAEPSRSAVVLRVVPAGTELALTGASRDGYLQVRDGDLIAWADAAYLTTP